MCSPAKEREQSVARLDAAAVDHFRAVNDADDEARDVILALAVEAGHLGGLAAEQHAVVLAATGGDALDYLYDDIGREHSCRT